MLIRFLAVRSNTIFLTRQIFFVLVPVRAGQSFMIIIALKIMYLHLGETRVQGSLNHVNDFYLYASWI